MSAIGLSGKTSFIPEYITIHRFSTKFKIRSCFFMNINRDYVSLETKFCSVCVFLIVTPSKLFALVFDFSALLGDRWALIKIAVYELDRIILSLLRTGYFTIIVNNCNYC